VNGADPARGGNGGEDGNGGGDGPAAEPRKLVGRLNRVGRCSEAIELADRLLAETTATHDVVGVLLAKLAALLNLNRMAECPAVVDRLWLRVQEDGATKAQVGEFHSMAADVAFRQGSMERCVTHLVRGARALDAIPADLEAMQSWMATATAYSFVGFHRQATAAHQRAVELAGLGTEEDRMITAQPEIRLRDALFLDQQGDGEAAKSVLAEVFGELGPGDVTVIDQPYLGYAVARYRVLTGGDGVDTGTFDVPALLSAGPDFVPENIEVAQLGGAVLAITEGRPREALDLLRDAHVVHARLGRAEIPRLKTFAYAAMGDFRSAYEAQREVTAMLARSANQLYDLFVDNVIVRLDYDELLRNVTRYAGEAHTDPLTGLPNRRHLERHAAALAGHGIGAIIGVADIDRFKDVNTVHGHLVGDQVLQQVAAVMSRTLRAGDFLARYAGDEFVVVLTDTDAATARDIAGRLTAAVAGHNWASIVPGTPVTLTIGLAELRAGTPLPDAFREADLLMLKAKRS
jgi:diguanylate cyclase (GGDEF)-like protein